MTDYEMSEADLQSEALAQRIIVAELLSIMQRGEEGTTRTRAIEPEEQELMDKLLPVLGVPSNIAEIGRREYFEFREGKSHTIDLVLNQGERNDTYRRFHGICHIIDVLGKALSQKENKWFGALTPDEYSARKYLDSVEQHMLFRRQAMGQRGLKLFDHDGLTLGNVAGLIKLLEEGDYGAFFGFPIDDTHTLVEETLHPLEVSIPILGKFMKERYNRYPSPGFLFHNAGPVSALLFTSFLSRAYQANDVEEGKLLLDPHTRQTYQFTRDYLDLLLINIFECGTTTVEQFKKENYGLVLTRDHHIDEVMRGILTQHTYQHDSAVRMHELKNVIRLKPAYDQIVKDDAFTDNEYALMNYALERCGIRHQGTRDIILDVQRNADGTVFGFSLKNLDALYSHPFVAKHYAELLGG